MATSAFFTKLAEAPFPEDTQFYGHPEYLKRSFFLSEETVSFLSFFLSEAVDFDCHVEGAVPRKM